MEEFLVFLNKNPLHIILLTVTVVSGSMLLWPLLTRLSKPGKEVGPLQAVQLINRRDAVVVDVREAGEYASGHITGSRHIPLGQLGTRLKELDKAKGKPIVVACATGSRSRTASALLEKQGHAEVYNLQGGVAAWRQAGMPVEK